LTALYCSNCCIACICVFCYQANTAMYYNNYMLIVVADVCMFQMPRDMLRSAPVLLSIPLPLAPYLIFPVASVLSCFHLLLDKFISESRLRFDEVHANF